MARITEIDGKELQSTKANIERVLTGEITTHTHPYSPLSVEKSTDYTILDDDLLGHINVTTGATDKTITMPTLADNLDRVVGISKVDSGVGTIIVEGEGAETVKGDANMVIQFQYSTAQLKATPTEWIVI